MKKEIIFLYFVLPLLNSTCFAETIYLKNGTKIEGRIVEKSEQQVKVDIRGMTLTYFTDEIDRIEGQAGQVALPQTPTVGLAPSGKSVESTPNIIKRQPAKLQPSLLEKISTQEPHVSSPSSPSVNKQQLIWKLIEASGTKANMDKIFNDMLSKASAEEAEKIQALFDINEIALQLIPIYEKYFEQDELQQLVDFYNSKGGQKLLAVTPLITQESMEATLQYFQNKVKNIETPQ